MMNGRWILQELFPRLLLHDDDQIVLSLVADSIGGLLQVKVNGQNPTCFSFHRSAEEWSSALLE